MLDVVLERSGEDFESHVARLQRYIRQPSISAEKRGNVEMAEMLAADIIELGGSGASLPGVDFPIVYGRFDIGAPRTVLIHSMYDTVPAEEPGWVVPPFEARRMDYGDLGDCIVGRGAEDTKGPVASIFSMIADHKAANVKLPVNLILLFESSELGSASLPGFVDDHLDELRQADVAYWPWHTGRADGTAVVWLGCKGVLRLKLRVRSGQWGGPMRSEIHSSNNAWVASPPQRLAAALACLKTEGDLDVAIEGYYDGVAGPTPDDDELIAQLAARLDPDAILTDLDVVRFKQGSFEDALRAYCFQSDFNVAAISSGDPIRGPGHKAAIPTEAVAAIDCRPLEGMDLERIQLLLRRHLDKHGFQEVAIEAEDGYPGMRMPVGNWAVQELLGAYRDSGFEPEVWPRTSIAIGAEMFTRRLGLPWLATCPGHAARKHSANEYIQLSGFQDAIEFMSRLMWRLAAAQPQG